MNFKSFVKEVALHAVCCLPSVILVVLMLYWLSDNAKVYQPVANEAVAKNATTDEIVVNNTADIVTATEVYKMVCTVDGESYCKEYSVRKINRE